MKVETLKIAGNNSIEGCPLPPEVIPNYMGINLCNVKHISWIKQDDGQLLSLGIEFIPEVKEKE